MAWPEASVPIYPGVENASPLPPAANFLTHVLLRILLLNPVRMLKEWLPIWRPASRVEDVHYDVVYTHSSEK
jgi:hypothetical protein